MWWQRKDLNYDNHSLWFAGKNLEAFASELEAPAFIYSAQRIIDNVTRLRKALDNNGFKNKSTIFYAMKANRFAPILTLLKTRGLCGVDVCSPAEVELATGCGFDCNEISYTGTSLTQTELSQLARKQGLIMNCDSLFSIDQWGQLKPGSEIGIRINPGMGVSRTNNQKLQYAGTAKPTKFGIYREQFEAAMSLVNKHQLKVTRLHFHTGCGYLNAELPQLEKIIQQSLWFIEQLPDLEWVNTGGGLGVPHTAEDNPLDLDAWVQTIHRFYGGLGIKLAIEPGEYIAKDAGVLLLEKTFCEVKKDQMFLGVNAGFNVAPEPAFYDMPFLPVPLNDSGERKTLNIVGNINEALDVWFENIDFPVSDNQTHIALINAGAYSSSMASNHCMRGQFGEYLLF
ncbi:MAG: hypothetical protein KDI92_13940 [Xanthomonadales bacterium]|nr:hypothetical protein [Xanthomonadales bacterium]